MCLISLNQTHQREFIVMLKLSYKAFFVVKCIIYEIIFIVIKNVLTPTGLSTNVRSLNPPPSSAPPLSPRQT